MIEAFIVESSGPDENRTHVPAMRMRCIATILQAQEDMAYTHSHFKLSKIFNLFKPRSENLRGFAG